MIKFKTKVCSSEVAEKRNYLSEIENEYTYYSTDGFTQSVDLNELKSTKSSAKPKGFFLKFFSSSDKDSSCIKKTRFKKGEKIFKEISSDDIEKIVFDKKGNVVRAEKHRDGVAFQNMHECIFYKEGKVNEVRYYGKDGNLIIEHYDASGKIYKISTKKY